MAESFSFQHPEGQITVPLGTDLDNAIRTEGLGVDAGVAAAPTVRQSATYLARHDADQIRRYVSAVKVLKGSTRPGASVSIYDEFVAMHLGVVGLQWREKELGIPAGSLPNLAAGPGAGRDGAHGGPAFLPWHRQYLRAFENALQAVDPQVAIPYWDWTDHLGTEFLLSPGLMGGDGTFDPATGLAPLLSGPFTANDFPVVPELHWRMRVLGRPWQGAENLGSTLNRDIQPSQVPTIDTSALATAADIARVMGRTAYGGDNVDPNTTPAHFRQELENGVRLHGDGHVWVGGSMRIMSSPNDPIFWMHHANIDRIWDDWQQVQKREWEVQNPGQGYDYAMHYYAPRRNEPVIQGHGVDHEMWPWDGGASAPARFTAGQEFPRPSWPVEARRAFYEGLFAPLAFPDGLTLAPITERVTVRQVLDLARMNISYAVSP